MAERAIRVASPEVLSLAEVARQCAELGRLDDALVLLEGLIVLEPKVAYLHTALGCVHMQSGRAGEALEHFEEALRLDPRDVAAHTYAGELQLRGADTAGGLAHLDAAIALDPRGTDRYANRARTLRLARPQAETAGQGAP